MKKDSDSLIGCFFFLLLPLGALWNGYVLSVLWGWFIVPTFEIRPLGVLPAIGVAMVVGYLTKQMDTYVDKSKSINERIIQSIVYMALGPAIALVFGWVLRLFM